MPQDLADFRQRGSTPQHLRRQAVAELMRALGRRIDARSLKGVSDDAVDRTRPGKTADRGMRPQEHTAAGTAGSSVPEVRGDRRADVGRDGEDGPGTAFASDGDLSAFPIQIVQLEKGHFARPQSQPRE
jgi:hypothetical protein